MTFAALIRSSSLMVAAAGLLAFAAPAPAHAADAMVGTFPVCYANKPKPGGVGVKLNLIVVAPSKTMSGQASFTQATNPPLDVTLDVKGDYTDVTKSGKTRHMAKLASADMPGRHVTMDLAINQNWKAAAGSYTLFLDTPAGTKKGKVGLRQVACAAAQ